MYVLFPSNIHERQLSRMVMSISDTVFKVIEQYGSFHKPVLTALDFVDFTGFSVRFPKHKR